MSKGNHRPHVAWLTAMEIARTLSRHRIMHDVCGSLRRNVQTSVGDIDMVVRSIPKTIEALKELNAEIILPQKSKFKTPMYIDVVFQGIKINIYQAAASNWGAMLLFLTGSGVFNIKMRIYAKAHGFKLNQYGLWGTKGGTILVPGETYLVAAKTERQIFKALGLRYIPPSEREFVDRDDLWKYKIGG